MPEFEVFATGIKVFVSLGIGIGIFLTLCLLTVVRICARMASVENN